ncbi:ankyrin repeat domain-containing protein 29-like [Ptychodera flava]|uniref:ankyrin repeat domain-containing protein 29-like n=1 Tax=Ptychodera flava TaxID=63121 RepID=UPI00396A9679
MGKLVDREKRLKEGALHIAAACGHKGIVNVLIGSDENNDSSEKLNLEDEDEENRTPLLVAAQHGQFVTVGHLLELGASIHKSDKYGNTALFLAAEYNHEDVVKLLLEKAKSHKDEPEDAETHAHGDSSTDVQTQQTCEDIEVQKGADSAAHGASLEEVDTSQTNKDGKENNTKTDSLDGKESSSEKKTKKGKNRLSRLLERFNLTSPNEDRPKDPIPAISANAKEKDFVNLSNTFGNTPLHIASKKGHPGVVKEVGTTLLAPASWIEIDNQ